MEQRKTEDQEAISITKSAVIALFLRLIHMDIFHIRYAELIIYKALQLKRGDVLSINTEERHSSFAHLLADISRKATGNGVYIQIIENGKVIETEEAATDYPIGKKPTALVYLQTYSAYPDAEEGTIYNAPELQRFRLLSDPLGNPTPALPYLACPMPSDEWGKVIDDSDGNEGLIISLLSDLLSLGEDEYKEIHETRSEILLYECDRLNSINLLKARITNEEGTDLEIEFLKDSKFMPSIETTKDGRKFVSSVFASDILRALNKSKTNGYLNITYPISLFGKKISNLSIKFENGRITSFDADKNQGKLFELFLSQDAEALFASMLSIAEDNNPASFIEYTAYPDWDRMRGVSLTIGGIKAQAVTSEILDKVNDSLVSLSLPIGSDSTSIVLYDDEGNEITIFEDGIILEDD